MNVGERIRQLRLSKLMTQTELAGTQITRNMLSSIEHGTALPSLPTAIYIAERLNVPVGYLLAEEDEAFFYRKMAQIGNVRRAFAAGDHAGCLALLAAFGEEADDELALIGAECEYGLAREALAAGRLHPAAAALDRALRAAQHCAYHTEWLRDRIAVCFRYLCTLSPTLASDVLDAEEIEQARAFGDVTVEYIMATEALKKYPEGAQRFVQRHEGSLYAQRVSALMLMREEDYRGAQTVLEGLLAKDELTFGVLLYEVFGDLERCYRKNDNYKRAYEFSGSRMGLLERLLEEI